MKKNFNYSSITILLLVVIVLVMSVGFASFSENLDIKGTTKVTGSSWNVGFDDSSYEESSGSVTVDANSRTLTGTSMTYELSLSKPGDFYEFTIDVVNNGTFDASLTGVTVTTLTEAQAKYLTYKLYYNGTEYSGTTSNITGVTLASGGTVPVKVRVEYIQPTLASDLPASTQTITLDASLSFVQKVS